MHKQLPVAGRKRRFGSGALILLGIAVFAPRLWPAPVARSYGPFTSQYEKSPPEVGTILRERYQDQIRANEDRHRLRVEIPDAVAPDLETNTLAGPLAGQGAEAANPETVSADPASSHWNLAVSLVVVFAAILALRKPFPKIGELLNRCRNPWTRVTAAAANLSANAVAEQEQFSEFIALFQTGPHCPATFSASAAQPASLEIASAAAGLESQPEAVTLEEFFAAAPRQLFGLRNLFSEISRAADQAGRQKILADLSSQLRAFKEKSGLPELLPLWQLASALEGLLKQLADKPSNVTASTLRTSASALDLLETLCVPGLKPNLATDPPVRFLVVDDDPISRHAVSLSLKKAFSPPDLAADGVAALTSVAREAYDLIFLDVEMPGMDGFEVCTRIHQSSLNQATPVVFVTSHRDFDSRAKATLTGGQDLIGKPFLSFEITVKALTLVMRNRLQLLKAGAAPAMDSQTGSRLAASLPSPAGEEERSVANRMAQSTVGTTTASALQPSPDPARVAGHFFAGAPVYLQAARAQLPALSQPPGEIVWQRALGQLRAGVRSLTAEADRAELRSVFRVASALETLLKKLLEQPQLCNPSVVSTAGAALDVIEEVCQAKSNPDLADPPIQLLVVDDEPVSLRALAGSVQLVFGRPDKAPSGEAALELAAQKRFDLIFLDVLMPGLDGFSTCSRIHETPLNTRTPVIFVTGSNDPRTSAQAAAAGGCGVIPKPVIASQIMLVALAFILRARLRESKSTYALEEAPA